MCGAATGALPEPTPRRPVQTPGTGKTCAQMHYMAIFRQYWGTVVLYDMIQAIICAQFYYKSIINLQAMVPAQLYCVTIFRQWFVHSCILWKSSGNKFYTFFSICQSSCSNIGTVFYMTFFMQWFVHICIIWQSSGPNFLTVVLYGNLQAILVQICSLWNSLGRGMYPFVVFSVNIYVRMWAD